MDYASRVTGTRTPGDALVATAGTTAARARRLRALADDLDAPHPTAPRPTASYPAAPDLPAPDLAAPHLAAPRLAGLTRGHADAVDELAATLRAAGAAVGPVDGAHRPDEPRTAG